MVEPSVIEDANGIKWVGITPRQYENLSNNLQDMLRYIRNQTSIIQYYRQCIHKTNNLIEAAP
jgi:hypothetical protein